MPLNIAIYAPTPSVITQNDLQPLVGNAKINHQVNPSGAVQSISIAWDDLNVTMNNMPTSQLSQHLAGLVGFARQMGCTPDVVQKLGAMRQVLGVVLDGNIDDAGRIKKFILGLVAHYNGFFFAGNALYDTNNQLVGGMPGARKRFFPADLLPETQKSLDRKQRSIARLQKEGVPTIAHLPVIEDEDSVKMRSQDGIVFRAVALAIVASHGATPDVKFASKLLNDYKITPHLSPAESHFVKQARPDQQECVNMNWRYESSHVLLWAVGFIDQLDQPTQMCDVQSLIEIINSRTINQLLAEAKLRSKSAILDEVDLIYRYSWATVNAHVSGQAPPAGLHPGVVFERHYALNWLRCYEDADWDDVATDT